MKMVTLLNSLLAGLDPDHFSFNLVAVCLVFNVLFQRLGQLFTIFVSWVITQVDHTVLGLIS